ncbi:hypothetical protein SeLEV6574_g07157 [Synchytrium endobioticum]|nr:hypothetical protein SeLEV6574_g07157 [Synchytrium endobioticum]
MWFAVYPVDVVKSKLQTDALAVNERRYRSAWDCVAKTCKAEGLVGLYRGFWVCMIRAFPVNGATFLAVETMLSIMS